MFPFSLFKKKKKHVIVAFLGRELPKLFPNSNFNDQVEKDSHDIELDKWYRVNAASFDSDGDIFTNASVTGVFDTFEDADADFVVCSTETLRNAGGKLVNEYLI